MGVAMPGDKFVTRTISTGCFPLALVNFLITNKNRSELHGDWEIKPAALDFLCVDVTSGCWILDLRGQCNSAVLTLILVVLRLDLAQKL
jgi:hypothetical protein